MKLKLTKREIERLDMASDLLGWYITIPVTPGRLEEFAREATSREKQEFCDALNELVMVSKKVVTRQQDKQKHDRPHSRTTRAARGESPSPFIEPN